MPKLDLQPAYRHMLLDVLAAHVPEAEVWAYGSRVNGRPTKARISILSSAIPPASTRRKSLHRLRDALAESDLPILVEVLDWARIPQALRREIERRHVVLAAPAHAAAK